MKYIVMCLFGCMLFRTAVAQDVVDQRNNQYLEGEGYVIYQSYPLENQPMREGPVGNSQLMPVGTSAPYIYKYDRQYNYENPQLNPEYNRPPQKQETPEPHHKQVSGILPPKEE